MVRRTESEEIMGIGYTVDDEEGRDGTQFITSAIGMNDLMSPTSTSFARPSEASKNEKGSDQQHAV